MASKTTLYYNSGTDGANKALEKKRAYQREYNKKPREVAKRVELNKANRDNHSKGKSRVGDGKDVAHTKRGLVLKKESVNRGSKTDSPGDRRARGCKK
jgi:hypothetical protein